MKKACRALSGHRSGLASEAPLQRQESTGLGQTPAGAQSRAAGPALRRRIWARSPPPKGRTESPPGQRGGTGKGPNRAQLPMARWGRRCWSTERVPGFPGVWKEVGSASQCHSLLSSLPSPGYRTASAQIGHMESTEAGTQGAENRPCFCPLKPADPLAWNTLPSSSAGRTSIHASKPLQCRPFLKAVQVEAAELLARAHSARPSGHAGTHGDPAGQALVTFSCAAENTLLSQSPHPPHQERNTEQWGDPMGGPPGAGGLS